MKPGSAVWIAVILAISIAHAAETAPTALVNRLRALAGAASENCGSVPLHDSPDAAIGCAKAAMESGRAYRLAVEFQGTDSIVWQGAVRDEQGKLWALFYDADAAASSAAGTTLSVVLCREIIFSTHGDDLMACRPILGEH